ncbi:hypothetical protein BDW59DRAFT_164807 [Aspergillus cavernicola]|uniref:RRM domain-containing protein n=1 Tax=Aspergillus cavernicola TaxID=176166 RepID=A0ABR4HWL0_9EURO
MSPPLADVDDTAAFMAAARSFKLEDGSYGTPAVGVDSDDALTDDHDASQSNAGSVEDVEVATVAASDELIEFPTEKAVSAVVDDSNKGLGLEPSVAAITLDSGAHTPATETPQSDMEEDREHLATFKSWGAPVARDKPTAKVRRVIIKDLPTSWRSPDKVLSLIHGGVIESVSVAPSGNAHVLFCDPADCKAFFNKYPNGIDLDKERKLTVFVDMGEDVDVISSTLSFSLSVGSSRVVRAVGVDMEVTMNELVKVATANSRKVEKIIDSYVPGYPRTVNFRFCGIADAVRFRAALVRNEDWEHCNVQYATDPCEVATGYHTD